MENINKALIIVVFIVIGLFLIKLTLPKAHAYSTVGEPEEFDPSFDFIFINTTDKDSLTDVQMMSFNNKTGELKELETVVMINELPS